MAACCCSDVIDVFTVRCYSDIFFIVEGHLFFFGFLSACPVNLFCWFYMIIRDEGYTNVFIVGFRTQPLVIHISSVKVLVRDSNHDKSV